MPGAHLSRMQFGKLRQAFAAANLVDLDVPPVCAGDYARTWAQRCMKRTGREFSQNVNGTVLNVPSTMVGGLYLSFHYADYPLIYKALSTSTRSPVFAIIGEQQTAQTQALEKLAAAHEVDIRFIKSEPSIVKKSRAALRDGAALVLLVDVPWAQSAITPDTAYSCSAGEILGHSTLERLIKLLDQEPRCLSISRQGNEFTIVERRIASLSEAYGCLGEQLDADPADYERLDSMHSYFRPSRPRSTLVCFNVGNTGFAVHPRSGGSWRLPPDEVQAMHKQPEIAGKRLVQAFEPLAGQGIDAVVAL